MVSSSPTTLATSPAAALGAPPTQLLMLENALVWKALIVLAMRGSPILNLVKGFGDAPAEILEAKDAKTRKSRLKIWHMLPRLLAINRYYGSS
jgi:hypothetical protein